MRAGLTLFLQYLMIKIVLHGFYEKYLHLRIRFMEQCQEIRLSWIGRGSFHICLSVIFGHSCQSFIVREQAGCWTVAAAIFEFFPKFSDFPYIVSMRPLCCFLYFDLT